MKNITVKKKRTSYKKTFTNGMPFMGKKDIRLTGYSQLFEKHPLPILLVDYKNFSIIEVNKAACYYYGYGKKTFSKLILSDIDPTLKGKQSSKILDIYNHRHLYSRHKSRSGTESQVEIYCSLFRNQGRLFSYLYVKEINEEKKQGKIKNGVIALEEKNVSIEADKLSFTIDQKEKQLNELKSRFLSTSSHEFRTPLSTILTSSELLLMVGRSLSEEKFLEYIIKIQNSVTYMTSLLDDLLAINKTEPGKWKFNPSRINLYNFCVKMIEEADNASTMKHNIIFDFRLQEKYAIIDDKLLQHVISNLLSNAIKYSPYGGDVILKVEQLGSNIEFIVSDNGIGISKQDQKHLFENFFRGKNTRDIQGSGLGLSIVKRSVESHGGEIKIKTKLNKGTAFHVLIPLMAVV